MSGVRVELVRLDLIDDPAAPLRDAMSDERLAELQASMAALGLLEPIELRPVGERFEVVFGHRRTMAARALRWERIPSQIRDDEEWVRRLRMATENLAREDLNPLEEAAYCEELAAGSPAGIEGVARLVHRSVAWVEARLSLLRWPVELREAVASGDLAVSAAAPLAGISDAGHRAYLVKHARENGATARVTRAWRQAWDISQGCVDPRLVAPLPAKQGDVPYDAHLPCWACGKRVSVGSMRYVWLCEDDLLMLAAARDSVPDFGSRVGRGPEAGAGTGDPADAPVPAVLGVDADGAGGVRVGGDE